MDSQKTTNQRLSFRERTLDDKIQIVIIWILRVIALIVSIFSLVSHGNIELILICIIGLLLLFLPDIIEYRYSVSLPMEYSFLIVAFMFSSIFLGELGDYYEKFWWWDDVLHLSAGVMTGFAGFLLLYTLVVSKRLQANLFIVSFLAFGIAALFGVLWEIVEFSFDHTIGTNMQNGSLSDTMFDLIIDLVGASISITAGYFFMRSQRHTGLFSQFINNFIQSNPHLKSRKN
jgi:hypothetical protein